MTLQFIDVIAAKDTHSVKVSCPEWGGEVELVTMQSAKYDELEARLTFARDNPSLLHNLRAEYVGACWADGSGKRAALSPNQAAQLGEKSPVVLDRLFEAARGLHVASEEAEKN